MAVRSVGEVDVENHRVVDCPSHAVADDLLVVLRLDHGKWLVHMWPAELVAGLVALVDALAAAVDGDLAVGEEVILAGDMLRVSACLLESHRDVAKFGGFLCQSGHARAPSSRAHPSCTRA